MRRPDRGERTEESSGAHEEGDGSDEASHDETVAGDTETDTNEAVLGVNIESAPLIALAVIADLALAAPTRRPARGRRRRSRVGRA